MLQEQPLGNPQRQYTKIQIFPEGASGGMRLVKTQGYLQVRRFVYLLICIMFVFTLFTGCSSSKQDSSASTSSSAEMQVATEQMSVATTQDSTNMSDAKAQDGEQPSASIKIGTTSMIAPLQGENGFNRRLIYTANLVLQVKDYAMAQTELRDIVAGNGAYILNFSENVTKTEIGGTYTIKVAANGFMTLLDSIETINKAKQRSIQGQDVTEEYVDLSARLKAKELVEKRLLNFMEQATKSDDLLAFSQELGKVQEEIEQIKGRMRYLDQNVAYSTIELRIYQLTESKVVDDSEDTSFFAKIKGAFDFSIQLLLKIAQGILIILTVLTPFIVILVVIGIPIWYYLRKRKAKSTPPNDDSVEKK